MRTAICPTCEYPIVNCMCDTTDTKGEMREFAEAIFHHAALGLGSKEPKHWEAALDTIIGILISEFPDIE